MNYDWIYREKAPKLLKACRSLIGTTEFNGTANNPTILKWAKRTQLSEYYNSDSIPWCGLYIAYCCYVAKLPICKNPLWALNWAKWGNTADVPMLADVLVFKRKGGGHVGIYVAEDDTHYHVLGGNQDNKVGINRIAKTRLFSARRTPWVVAQPSNIRRVFVDSTGKVSLNEQ